MSAPAVLVGIDTEADDQWSAAGREKNEVRNAERLPALQARRLARKAVSVVADTPVAEAIRGADESHARAVVIVDHEDKPIAILNETAVMATPEQRRPWLEAGSLARTLEPSLVLPAEISETLGDTNDAVTLSRQGVQEFEEHLARENPELVPMRTTDTGATPYATKDEVRAFFVR